MPPKPRKGKTEQIVKARRQGKTRRYSNSIKTASMKEVDERIKEILVAQHIPASRVEVIGKDEIVIHNN